MKKFLFFFFMITFCSVKLKAQHDPQLIERLTATLKFTQLQDLDKLMDYTYPKLFTIAPREQLIEAMKSVYDTDEYTTSLDSINIDTIFPAFKINNAEYVKIRHTMLMKMKFKNSLDSMDAKESALMVGLLENEFGAGNVRLDLPKSTILIQMKPDMVGVKDEYAKEWCFANLDEDNPALLDMLFSKEVQAKLNEYK